MKKKIVVSLLSAMLVSGMLFSGSAVTVNATEAHDEIGGILDNIFGGDKPKYDPNAPAGPDYSEGKNELPSGSEINWVLPTLVAIIPRITLSPHRLLPLLNPMAARRFPAVAQPFLAAPQRPFLVAPQRRFPVAQQQPFPAVQQQSFLAVQQRPFLAVAPQLLPAAVEVLQVQLQLRLRVVLQSRLLMKIH